MVAVTSCKRLEVPMVDVEGVLRSPHILVCKRGSHTGIQKIISLHSQIFGQKGGMEVGRGGLRGCDTSAQTTNDDREHMHAHIQPQELCTHPSWLEVASRNTVKCENGCVTRVSNFQVYTFPSSPFIKFILISEVTVWPNRYETSGLQHSMVTQPVVAGCEMMSGTGEGRRSQPHQLDPPQPTHPRLSVIRLPWIHPNSMKW